MPNVLIVDDDPRFMDSAEQMLVRAGYHVLCAMDGSKAMDVVEEQHEGIDLAIVDLSLPGINGFELIGAITRRPGQMKIIATTGVYKEYHLQLVETLGAHAIIRKPAPGTPLPEAQWLTTIRKLIGDGTPQADSASR